MAAPATERSPLKRPLRLFYALWPDPGTAASLRQLAQALRGDCGGRPTPPDNLHLTLAFLGAVPPRSAAALVRIGAAVASSVGPFSLRIDYMGCWRRHGLVWAAPAAVPAALDELAARLGASLRVSGFASEPRTFRPHVTLLRAAVTAPAIAACGPFAWPVRELVLARSEHVSRGVRYRAIGSWPLSGG